MDRATTLASDVCPRTAAALAEYKTVRTDESHSGWGPLAVVSIYLVNALIEERVLERLAAAEAVVDAVKTRRTNGLLRQGNGAEDERQITAALAAYDAAQQAEGVSI